MACGSSTSATSSSGCRATTAASRADLDQSIKQIRVTTNAYIGDFGILQQLRADDSRSSEK
jgi:hypothetical protein